MRDDLNAGKRVRDVRVACPVVVVPVRDHDVAHRLGREALQVCDDLARDGRMVPGVEQQNIAVPDHGDDVARDDRVEPFLEEAVDGRRYLDGVVVERAVRGLRWCTSAEDGEAEGECERVAHAE